MEYPIVYRAEVAKNRLIIILTSIIGIGITGIGIVLRSRLAELGEKGDEGAVTAALYMGLFFLAMSVLLYLSSKLRARQEANTTYTVERNCFKLIIGKKGKQEIFEYKDYIFTNRIQRINGSPIFTMIMEDRKGKKHKRILVLREKSFCRLSNDISVAADLFNHDQAGA